MMYTKFIKGIIDLLVKGSIAVAALIALLVMFFGGDNFGNSFLIGIIIAVIIVFLALLPVALFGMLVEMSENMNAMRELLESGRSVTEGAHSNAEVQLTAKKIELPSNEQATEQAEKKTNPDNLNKLANEASEKSQVGENWECPECGELNPMSTRMCRHCYKIVD